MKRIVFDKFLPDKFPIAETPYRITPKKLQKLKFQSQELVNKSSFNQIYLHGALVLFMKKDDKMHMCIKYTELNKMNIT